MKKVDRNYYIIIVIAALLFIPFLGHVHLFDWDEINFAEAAREMLRSDNYSQVQIDYQPFWEKPPLFIWTEALSMKIFGVNEFAARLPNALIGIITLCLLYSIGKKLYDKKMGLIWAAVYAGSFLPHFYFKSALIDPAFNLFIFTSIWFISRYYETVSKRKLLIAGLFTGLAVLTKGPVALLIIGISWLIFFIIKKEKPIPFILNVLIWLSTSILTAGLWFLFIIITNGWQFFIQFIQYQVRLLSTHDAGHGGFLLYHWVILFFGVFPASVFFIQYLINIKKSSLDIFSRLMMISFWLVLVLFTLVQTKIVHYSSFCYFPLTFFAARNIYERSNQDKPFSLFQKITLVTLLVLTSFAVLFFIFIGKHVELVIAYINDLFVQRNLDALVYWPSSLYLLPFLYLVISLLVLFNKRVGYKKFGYINSLLAFFALTAVFLEVMMVTIVPRVEAITQRAAIEFYQSKAKEDCYIQVLGFKSYAQYFYADKKPTTFHPDEDWLLNTNTGKPTYFVCKYGQEEKYLSIKNVKLLYKKNGFVFMTKEVRSP